MAYASVSSLLQTIDILLDHHQSSIYPQFKTQIISIHHHTSFLQSFIEGSSDRVNNWEETIRQVTNKAEDIIELLVSDSLLKSTVGSSRSELEKGKYEVCYSLDELEIVADELESIVNKVKGGRHIERMVGVDDEVMEIVDRLVGGSSSLEMIAICGSGGMGKTTLAKNAYYHPIIKEHFDVRAGCRFSREYSWVSIFEALLRSMKAEYSRSDSEDELIQRFLRHVGRGRYLIWLDDVWSKDVLERLKMMLPDYGNGSRIILITRSSDLANSAHHIHEMRLLDEDRTWDLLRQKIFRGDPCPFQLEPLGKTIARSCGGHPLSIAVVSGILLASDQTEAVWEDVSDNMMKIASDKVDEILYLSYIYLPHHLRPCFLYLGIFMEGGVIYVSKLVKAWVAEGFMNESGSKSLEETGEDYVEDLFRRSLVSVHRTKSDGGIKIIEVHDLVRGMCIRQAHIDNFNLHLGRDAINIVPEIIRSCRRASNLYYCGDFLRGVYGSTIRTLSFDSEYGKLDLRCWMGNVRLLRILNLLSVKNYSLSDEVFELFHLRYLALYHKSNIPKAISNLENLQTLIILHEEGGMFDNLPEGIWRMPQLRHLCVFSFVFPNKKGPTSTLQNLHTLSQAVDFVCSSENLKMIPNVKKLDLLYTKKLNDVVEDYELHNLTYLQKLEVLKVGTNLSIGEEHKMRFATFPPTLIEKLLEALKINANFSFGDGHKMSCAAFPKTLKKLSLRGLQLSWEDMKMVASLPNLQVLKLRNYACAGDTWETSEGGFSLLIFLRIEESNLENWITKSSHFPRLWQLVLVRCWSLLEVPDEMADIPTLNVIELDGTNHSLLRSATRIQKDRNSLGHAPILIIVK